MAKGDYVCKYCGKDCKNPNALELHLKFCRAKKENGECSHNFRLLDPNKLYERRALEDGYIQVCIKCGELE